MVSVTSPIYGVPQDIERLEFDVVGLETGQRLVLNRDVATLWPHTLLVLPGSSDSEEVEIRVTGSLGGSLVSDALVNDRFEAGVIRTTEVVLGQGVPGGDGGVSGGRDGDVGGDSGGDVASECVKDEDCDDGVRCTVDVCADGACLRTPNDLLCEESTTCDPEADCPPRTCIGDSNCDDGLACNGIEVCVDQSCQVVEPFNCSDGEACTFDQCIDLDRATCVHSTRDEDEDGFGDELCDAVGDVPATDCNDRNPEIFPGAPEVCNGVDDDCNGVCDEPGACCRGEVGDCITTCDSTGSRTCSLNCSWTVCVPPTEVCNGVDDDCNGTADDIFACVSGASEPCTTTCGSTGTRRCDESCTWTDCEAPSEVCNGLDDDCDGEADEDFDCVRGVPESCTTSCDTTGSRACGASCTLLSCEPPSEACNGIDDDCDDEIDETVECSQGESEACTTTCGSSGNRVCSALCVWQDCIPPDEVCNNADDDCDGSKDEDFDCVPGSVVECTTTCDTEGTRTCGNGCTYGACQPPVEACNGVDDDCDGDCDESFNCCAGETGSCTTSCGTTGSRTCSSACGWSACSPPEEVCNGQDDDCNAACDDGFECCAGSNGSCTTSCGSTGTRDCATDCSWNACVAPDESCNGDDDDCDGDSDEDFDCIFGDVESCTTSCGSNGERTCGDGCTWGSCEPPVESCNGVDDDCDGDTDEGCGSCGACGGATSISAPGGRYSVELNSSAETGSCGGDGSDVSFSFTTSAASDLFVTTHGAGLDTVIYVRECACDGDEEGCNDDADGMSTSRLRLTNLAAGTYNIFIDSHTEVSASFDVDIYITAAGDFGDRCGQPEFIAPGTTVITGNTCSLGADTTPHIAAGTDCSRPQAGFGPERIYYFYLDSSTTLTADACVAGTNYDATVYIRSVCTEETESNQVACVDDDCGGPPSCTGDYRANIWREPLSPGLYYLFADGNGDSGGVCPCGNFEYELAGF
jgi:hypothetical protein